MANKQSTLLSNRASQTSVKTPNDPANERGKLRTVNGNVALAAGDLSATDTVMLCAVPVNAVVLSIKIASDDLDTGTTLSADVGLWEDIDGGTAKDDDAYASAVTDWRTATAFTEYAFEARGIEKNGQKVWQDAGDASLADATNEEYFIGVLFDAAGNQAGDLAFQVTYAVE